MTWGSAGGEPRGAERGRTAPAGHPTVLPRDPAAPPPLPQPPLRWPATHTTNPQTETVDESTSLQGSEPFKEAKPLHEERGLTCMPVNCTALDRCQSDKRTDGRECPEGAIGT